MTAVDEIILESIMRIVDGHGLLTGDKRFLVNILINVFQRLEIIGMGDKIFEFQIFGNVSTDLGRGIAKTLQTRIFRYNCRIVIGLVRF